ncbi:MAG: MerR family transcriptional regulator [Caulobacterales bacterium]|nr:MerR family transcriptional regulator [Caulobacterales bacterium]
MAKSPNAFRTISEAADEVGAPQHVLRFWETKFSFIAPVKRAGGRRFYRPQDVAVLIAVKKLLHDDGLTIRGVQRLHKDGGLKRLLDGEGVAFETVGEVSADAPTAPAAAGSSVIRLQRLLAEIEGARTRLDAVLTR